MDFSDDEDNKIQEEVNAFRSIIPNRNKGKKGGHGDIKLCSTSTNIREECTKLMNEILEIRIQDTVKKICDTIIENRTENKSIVIVLNIKRNQKKDLQKFINKFENYIFEVRESLKSIHVEQLAKDDVRDIALDIQIHEDNEAEKQLLKEKIDKQLEKAEGKKHKTDLILYVNRRVTNLSQANIHVFDGSVIKANYAAIIPTHENLKVVDGLGIVEQNEMFYFEAYNNKELFIEFFYRCLVSRTIMAYLPSQVLGLIKLYDYYPLSYQQGCNMLIYACQALDEKCEKNKLKKKEVEMKELIRIFNRTWRMIWKDEMEVARYNYYQLSHVILDEKASYTVPESKIINFIRMTYVKDIGIDDINEENFYKKFIKKFKEKLENDENLKHTAKFFDEYEDRMAKNEIKKMKKNAREIKLGIETKHLKTEKQLFEDKITYLFKQATAEVRRQAKYVEWEELNIFEVFEPQLVKDTVNGVLQDPDFRDVFSTIRSSSNYPMGRLIEKFKGMEIGKLVYIIRCLELKGLVELTKNTLRPSLVTNFYDKAKFRMSGNE